MIDVSNKNSAIGIIFFLEILFFSVAVFFMMFPNTKDIGDKVWTVFMGANGALFLLLNTEARKELGIPNGNGNGNGKNPTQPGEAPEQPQQSTTKQ